MTPPHPVGALFPAGRHAGRDGTGPDGLDGAT